MSHLDQLTSLIDLDNLTVVDVGAGDGKFARAFARRGARVIGVEIDDAKVAIAKKAGHADVEIRLGRGEDLPVDDGSADLVCFMFSFHHVPDEVQERALLEAHRVLKPGGRLHLVEPRPYGPMAEVMRDIADETQVLTSSQARLDRLATGAGLFSRLSASDYTIPLKTPDFETFLRGIIAVDPRRAEKLPAARTGMEAAFRERAEAIEDGFRLEQPCIAHHFVRVD
jgi:SAM-dependent methyltransferase